MCEVPGEATAQLQGIQHLVARLEKIRGQDTVTVLELLDHCGDEATAHMCEGRAKRCRRQANQMFQAPALLWIQRQPGANHQHPGRMHYRIERLLPVRTQTPSKGAVKALGDVMDRHVVTERDV